MAEHAQHEVPLQRRHAEKTDYGQRLELLKAGVPRAVIRPSNNGIQVQLVGYQHDGDETLTAATHTHLTDHGWDHHTGNLPAAYLTGFLAGKRAQDAGIQEAVPDLGIYKPEYGSRQFAAIKGLQDAGLTVNADPSVFPAEDRVNGVHAEEHGSDGITDAVDSVKQDIEDSYEA